MLRLASQLSSLLVDPLHSLWARFARCSKRKLIARITWGAVAGLMLGTANAQRIPFGNDSAVFDPAGLLRGVDATKDQCDRVGNAVWVRHGEDRPECLRYWLGGFPREGATPRVLVYLTGDQMAFDMPDPGYGQRSPRSFQSLVEAMAAQATVPVLLLARPGTFGSSGEHRQRRRELEPRLMSEALDVIKQRLGVEELTVVGLSGGGHILASLLGWRSDIVCAVAVSSISTPRMRWERMGRTTDFTGFADSYEPLDALAGARFHPKLRVFVLGDPRDTSVPWETQTPLADRLRELGVMVEVVKGEGSDSQHHALGASGRALGAMCLRGQTTPEILRRAAQGLRG